MSLSFYARDAGLSDDARSGLDRYDTVPPRTALQEETAHQTEKSPKGFRTGLFLKDYPSTRDADYCLLISLGVNGEVPLAQAKVNAGLARKMPDCALGEPKRKFSDTFHAVDVLEQRFFPANDNEQRRVAA